MKKEAFDELLKSLEEGAAILKGELKPSRKFVVDEIDVKAVRRQLGLSQREFAVLLGVSIDTVQNWEQGRRRPRGAARMLLYIAQEHPETLIDVMKKVVRRA